MFLLYVLAFLGRTIAMDESVDWRSFDLPFALALVMLVLLSRCPLCYLFVPCVLLCWGGVRFPGEFGVLVHPRLR